MKISSLIACLALLAMSTVLSGQEITVTSPTAGDEWRSGTTHSITWTTSGIMPNRVTVSLRNAGSRRRDPDALVIAADTENDGNVSWPIPGTLAAGEYFIRVRTISPDPQAVVIGESANFRITTGIATIPMVPFQPRCDLELAGVGVEYYRDNVVAWVKNNGPNAINQDVKFRLNFPELGGGEQIITRRLTIPVGEERRVDLQPLAASAIPDTGLRTSVRIDTSGSGISDGNIYNQHRDVRIWPNSNPTSDLAIRLDRNTVHVTRVVGGGTLTHYRYRLRATLQLRNNSPSSAEIASVPCSWTHQYPNSLAPGWVQAAGTTPVIIQVGPVRSGEWTSREVTIEFLIHHNWVEHDNRILFELDPERRFNDPDRNNNQAATGAFRD